MKQITFLGAAGEVTGSSHLLTDEGAQSLLVDLGMFQGSAALEELNFQPLTINVKNLQGVVITHAHLDHCGRLPLLLQAGYSGKIYATQVTKDIIYISLLDSARILHNDPRGSEIYTEEAAETINHMIEVVEYNQPVTIGTFKAVYRNAGHILGSATVDITDSHDQIVVFSGDLGNTPQELIQPTEYTQRGDAVVIESTYGNASHPVEDAYAIVQHEINEIEKTNGTLLIPAFAIERTQELLHIIGHLKAKGKIYIDTPVFLDSPMAIEVTELFKQHHELYSDELKRDTSPFEFPGLVVTSFSQDSRAIRKVKKAKVIIAGSGMMNGGRILQHLKNYVDRPTTRILIVGYQAEETLGREIEEGAQTIVIDNHELSVLATITKMHSLSSHADQPRLMKWLQAIKGAKQVFIVHGDEPQRQALAEKIRTDLGITSVVIPLVNEEHPFV